MAPVLAYKPKPTQGPEMLFLLLKALISISAPFSPVSNSY